MPRSSATSPGEERTTRIVCGRSDICRRSGCWAILPHGPRRGEPPGAAGQGGGGPGGLRRRRPGGRVRGGGAAALPPQRRTRGNSSGRAGAAGGFAGGRSVPEQRERVVEGKR